MKMTVGIGLPDGMSLDESDEFVARVGRRVPGFKGWESLSFELGQVCRIRPMRAIVDAVLAEMGLPPSVVSCFGAADEDGEYTRCHHVGLLGLADGPPGHDPAPGIRPPCASCTACGRPMLDGGQWSPQTCGMQKHDLFVRGVCEADLFCRPRFQELSEGEGLTGLRFLPFRDELLLVRVEPHVWTSAGIRPCAECGRASNVLNCMAALNLAEEYRFDLQVVRTAAAEDAWQPFYVVSTRAALFLKRVNRRCDPLSFSPVLGWSTYLPVVPGHATDVIRPTPRFCRAGEGPTSVIPEFELPAGS